MKLTGNTINSPSNSLRHRPAFRIIVDASDTFSFGIRIRGKNDMMRVGCIIVSQANKLFIAH